MRLKPSPRGNESRARSKKVMAKKLAGKTVDFTRKVARVLFTYEKMGDTMPHRYEIVGDIRLTTNADGSQMFSGQLSRHRNPSRIGGIGHFRTDQPIKIEAVDYAS